MNELLQSATRERAARSNDRRAAAAPAPTGGNEQSDRLAALRNNPLAVNREGAAALLGISVPEVDKLIRSGEIEAFKIGKRWIIPVSSLEKWLSTRAEAYARELEAAAQARRFK